MKILLNIDEIIFSFLNQSISNNFFDLIMPFLTNLDNWRIPIVIFVFYLIFKGGRKGRVVVILIIFIITACDQFSASVLKPVIGRIRPCHDLENVRIIVGCGGKFSFPSSHATNMAGFAMIFSLLYHRWALWFWFLALTIGFTRIYIGVHYPGDVLYGFILGSAISVLIFSVYMILASKYPFLHYHYQNDIKTVRNSKNLLIF